MRVVLPGDRRNIRSESDAVTVTVQQAQVADFTINTSQPIIPEGSTATISGVLYQKGTTTPEPSDRRVALVPHRRPGDVPQARGHDDR